MNTKKWERRDLKERAKVAVKRNYWWCVLAALILFLITGGGSGNSKDDQDQNQDNGPVVSINLSELDIHQSCCINSGDIACSRGSSRFIRSSR